MKRVITLLLAVVMLGAVCAFAVSCGDDNTSTTTTTATQSTETTAKSDDGTTATDATEATTATDATDATDATTATDATEGTTATEATTTTDATDDPGTIDTWDGTTKMPGYLNKTFNGKEFLICANNDTGDDRWFNPKEIWVESLTGDAINDAVYTRNKTMHDLYDCTIKVDDGGWENGFNADLASGGGKYIATSAEYYNGANGNFYNILNLNIDWSQSWFNQAVIRDLACSGKLYVFAGDFALNDFSATWIMFYNKDVYDQNLADEYDIYDIVDQKKWTIDMLLTMCQKVASNNDGTEGITFSEEANADMIGMATTEHNYRALYFACGERYVVTDESTGKFKCGITASGRGYDVIEKARKLIGDDSYQIIGYTSVQKAIQNGTTLFAGEVMDVLARMVDAENLRVGVVPQPLYAEGEDYCHYVNNRTSLYLIPTGYSNLEEICDFFTLYAAHSQKIVRSAYINAYKYTYANDDDSARMVDLILNSRIYDPGYNPMNLATSSMEGALGSFMSKDGSNKFKSATKKYTGLINDAIDAYIAKIEAIQDPV